MYIRYVKSIKSRVLVNKQFEFLKTHTFIRSGKTQSFQIPQPATLMIFDINIGLDLEHFVSKI